jgi:hypothetical protein
MDRDRFDRLARSLAQERSRRSLLRGLTGAAIFAAPRAARAAGTCTPPGPRNFCNADSECCSTALCRNGACVCPAGTRPCGSTCAPADRDCGCPVAGQRRCNGACIDAQRDRQNCGSCGNVCQPGKTCSLGKCCPKGRVNCNGVCKPKIDCPPLT